MTEVCLSCALDDCDGCELYQCAPELGCCCGHIQPGEDDDDDEDWAAQPCRNQPADEQR
jgi:hypothetical protein